MQETIIQFFEIVGISPSAPETFPELITWLVYVFVAVMIVLTVFHVIAGIVNCFLTLGRR